VQSVGRIPGPLEDVAPRPTARLITGGIVAHNDERRIARSIRSLLSQELPPGAQWGRIWVVASGCSDRTVEIARSFTVDEPRLGVVVEAERRGKAAAIREVLRRAEGDYLVLLNSDAAAAPGSVAALVARAEGKARPFAVMARPTVPPTPDGSWSRSMRWMWEFHHELHLEMLKDGRGGHLSDELLLVSLPAVSWIEEGIINDGSYCAVWLQGNSGGCWYAPEAQVAIDVPNTPADHLRQRRRIHVGNAQVTAQLGRPPTTALRFLFEHPRRAVGALGRALSRDQGFRHLLRVALWELVSHALAAWDRLPPRRDHVRWSRITTPAPSTEDTHLSAFPATGSTEDVDRRIRVILDVAREFGTGVPVAHLTSLLPGAAPSRPEDLESFLSGRPDLAQVVQRSAYLPTAEATSDPSRVGRGALYRRTAQALVEGPLAWLRPTMRCIGVTGSAAYGEPAAHDDLDFFVVTRAGALPWFLAATYASLRLHGLRARNSSAPVPCFNYVIDERRAPGEFASGRGLLFAREALTAQILEGDDYYRGLLARTPWLGTEIPRLYAARSSLPGDTSERPASWTVRALSAAVYLPLAAYLQAAGLRRDALARHSSVGATFRTLTDPDRIAFQSRRFEELRSRYQGSVEPSSTYPGATTPSRFPSSR